MSLLRALLAVTLSDLAERLERAAERLARQASREGAPAYKFTVNGHVAGAEITKKEHT